MRGFVILLIVIVLVGYVGTKMGGMYIVKSDLALRLEERLDQVEQPASVPVKKDLIADADKLGIYLDPAKINIVYEDTEQHSLPQRYVERIAQFTNKQVAIEVQYTVRILGIPFHHEITRSKIKQIQVRRAEQSPEMKKLLEGDP